MQPTRVFIQRQTSKHGVIDRARKHGLSTEAVVRSNFHACAWSELLKWTVWHLGWYYIKDKYTLDGSLGGRFFRSKGLKADMIQN